jgi:hypothetical protein
MRGWEARGGGKASLTPQLPGASSASVVTAALSRMEQRVPFGRQTRKGVGAPMASLEASLRGLGSGVDDPAELMEQSAAWSIESASNRFAALFYAQF